MKGNLSFIFYGVIQGFYYGVVKKAIYKGAPKDTMR